MEFGTSFSKLSIAPKVGAWAIRRQKRVELDPKEAGLRAMAHAYLNVPNDVSSLSDPKT